MIKASVEELLKKIPSAYKLVILASRRTFAINDGAPPLTKAKISKPMLIALEEIKEGKITFKQKAQGNEPRPSNG